MRRLSFSNLITRFICVSTGLHLIVFGALGIYGLQELFEFLSRERYSQISQEIQAHASHGFLSQELPEPILRQLRIVAPGVRIAPPTSSDSQLQLSVTYEPPELDWLLSRVGRWGLIGLGLLPLLPTVLLAAVALLWTRRHFSSRLLQTRSAFSSFRDKRDALFAPPSGNDALTEVASASEGMLHRASSHARVLVERIRLRKELLHEIIHDLRSPLAVLRCAVDSSETRVFATSTRIHQAINRYIATQDTLLNYLRTLSSPLLDQAILKIEEFDLDALVSEVAASIRPRAAASGTRIEADLPGTPILVHADRTLLTRVLTNLVENALAHAGDHLTITIRLQPTDRGVEVSVIDDGKGIPESRLPLLFGRFGNLHSPTHTSAGAGIGLAIVGRVLELHGSRCRVRSAVGHGSEFAFHLHNPVNSLEERAGEKAQSPQSAAGVQGLSFEANRFLDEQQRGFLLGVLWLMLPTLWTVGASPPVLLWLIAAMLLVWRTHSPVKQGASSFLAVDLFRILFLGALWGGFGALVVPDLRGIKIWAGGILGLRLGNAIQLSRRGWPSWLFGIAAISSLVFGRRSGVLADLSLFACLASFVLTSGLRASWLSGAGRSLSRKGILGMFLTLTLGVALQITLSLSLASTLCRAWSDHEVLRILPDLQQLSAESSSSSPLTLQAVIGRISGLSLLNPFFEVGAFQIGSIRSSNVQLDLPDLSLAWDELTQGGAFSVAERPPAGPYLNLAHDQSNTIQLFLTPFGRLGRIAFREGALRLALLLSGVALLFLAALLPCASSSTLLSLDCDAASVLSYFHKTEQMLVVPPVPACRSRELQKIVDEWRALIVRERDDEDVERQKDDRIMTIVDALLRVSEAHRARVSRLGARIEMPDTTWEEYREELSSAVEEAEEFVAPLFDFVRIAERGKLSSRSIFDLREELDELRLEYAARLSPERTRITLEIPDEALIFQQRQLFTEILRKYFLLFAQESRSAARSAMQIELEGMILKCRSELFFDRSEREDQVFSDRGQLLFLLLQNLIEPIGGELFVRDDRNRIEVCLRIPFEEDPGSSATRSELA